MPGHESDHQHRILLSRILLTVLIVISSLTATLPAASGAEASPKQQATATTLPQPTPTFDIKRLEKPAILSESPTQVEAGSLKYWGVCMACHGDRGQGLTDEWRGAYDPEDRNCWRSGCHGDDHPPESFLLPQDKIIPSIAGAGSLTRFKNARELHDFILANMPWWNPGQLTGEEAWQVTAYILYMHKVLPDGLLLTGTNASAVMVQYAVPQPPNDRPAILTLTGILALAALGLMAQDARKILELKRPAGEVKTSLAQEKPNFFHHLHPPTIPALQARFRYTLGAGGLAVFLCLILLISGMLEMYYYIPVPEYAAVSVETITALVPFGALIRNLHFWSAQALVVVMSIHLLRIVLTGAYARHRRLNYLIGMGMLVLILLLDFTGYVLRWDEGIRWALIVGTNLLKTVPWIGESLYQLIVGGLQPGLSSLERFYTWHIFVLTLLTVFLGAWHIFRVRRDGGIAVPLPHQRQENSRISRFELVRREAQIMLVSGVILILISLLFPAPIEQPITHTAVGMYETRAPWFFLWVQQLLRLGDPFLWGVAAPALLLVILALLPYIFPQPGDHELGRWFPRGNRSAQIIIITITLIVTILTLSYFFPNTQP
jgi:quinol-cytochrome oxidoreductase complex cytochrome b subunit/mono/diheme cytochrome c family protein